MAVDRLVSRLDLKHGATVLDIGCGMGEWVLRISELYNADCLGIDVSPLVLSRASGEAARRFPGKHIQFRLEEAAAMIQSGRQFDLVLCVGSTHAVGGLAALVAALPSILRPGGQALIGDGFWESTPTPEVRENFGGDEAELHDLATTVDVMMAGGMAPLDAHISAASEWDRYEWAWTGSLERHVRIHPDDPDTEALRALAAEHRHTYLRGYRGVLGFITCLLGMPQGNRPEV